jgi:hypothetical protein
MDCPPTGKILRCPCPPAVGTLPVLAGVHHPAALADLPEPERQEWQAFWQEVGGLLREEMRS